MHRTAVSLLATTFMLAGCGSDADPTMPDTPVSVTSVSVTATPNPVDLPGTVQATATVAPADAPQSVTWSSSDGDIATVNASGLITTHLLGPVTITATSTAAPSISGFVVLGIECPDPRLVTANLTEDTTWENWIEDPACFDYVVQASLSTDDETLVIEAGTVVGFEAGHGIRVRAGAGLVAAGTEDEPIVLTGIADGVVTDERGFWDGVALEATTFAEHIVTWTTIEYAGVAVVSGSRPSGLVVIRDVTVRLENNTFRNNDGYGLFLGQGADITGSGANRMTLNALGPAYVYGSQAANLLPGGDMLTGNDIDEVVVYPDNIATDAVWPLATYYIERQGPQAFNVFAGLTLTAGSTLRFEADQAVLVGIGGSLSAIGTAAAPIVLTGTEAVPGHWRGLGFTDTNSALNRLEHVTIEYGGGAGIGIVSQPSNLVVTYGTTPSRVTVTNSTFRHSAQYGVYARIESTLDDFTGNTLTSNAAGAASLDAPVVADVMAGNSFIGNGVDEISVNVGTGMDFTEATVWLDHGVPYFLKQLNAPEWRIVGDAFTLSPGVEMLFGPDVRLALWDGASLTAEGEQNNRISFRAKTTQWGGIDFQDATGSFDYADVADGAVGGNPASILIRAVSSSANVMFTGEVTLTGATYSIAFSYGNSFAQGCVGSVYIPPGDAFSDHCRPPG